MSKKKREKPDEEAPVASVASDADVEIEATVDADEPDAETADESAEHVVELEVLDADEEPDEEPDELSQARQEADDYKDRWMRATADLENFRRRAARDREEQMLRVVDNVLRQLLEPMDNLARGIKEAEAEQERTDDAVDAFARGMLMVYEQFVGMLERENVKVMEAVGQPFDPMLHDAMATLEREDLPPNTVVDEIERGYRHGERVLRHAKVVVSKAPATDDAQTQTEAGNDEDAENTDR